MSQTQESQAGHQHFRFHLLVLSNMGIRFFCPNGHKLNVKEHLAGKAGFCPECGARLVIPYHSTRKSSKELGKENTQQPAETASPFSMTPSSFFVEEMQQSQPELTLAPEPKVESINPILQDQTVVWYIQVPNGPQYGPATGQVVHSWIQENRIGPTMLVWREGWSNWLEAKSVFPELASE